MFLIVAQQWTLILTLEFTKTIVLHVKGRTWKVTPQLCCVCKVGVKSKAALAFHLKQCHPDSQTYQCLCCDGVYNNADDLASHFSNAHSMKNVKCKHCAYSATSAARMRIHVWKHTMGEQCKYCGHTYPTLHSL